ncbi:MAG: TolC family protein [Candidatus Omnitrophica bacterium]|nr:TolC family protein [Candidatus Omnitrophota bacterium]
MRKRILICLLLSWLIFPSLAFGQEDPEVRITPAEERSLTLMECYRLALAESEIIAIDAQTIEQARAHFLSAFEDLFPEVSFHREDKRLHSSRSPASNRGFDQKFVFSQPIFTGFKEFAGMTKSHYETEQRKSEKKRAEELLLRDVSDAFYLLLEKQEDQKVLLTIKGALEERIKDLNARVDIGRSRTSEVVNTETQLYTLLANIESVKSQELVARELLQFLTGRYIDKVTDPEFDFHLKTSSEYLSRSAKREDVLAAYFEWKAAKENILYVQSGFLPTVSLDVNRYGHKSSSPEDSRWDTLISVDIPIFEKNTTLGEVQEAIAAAKVKELYYRRVKRLAIQEIYDDYINLRSVISMRDAYKKARDSAAANFELQKKDYQQNLVSNLEVLTAIGNQGDTERNYLHARFETKRSYWKLLVDSGAINGEIQ